MRQKYDQTMKTISLWVTVGAVAYFGIIAISSWPNISQRTMAKKPTKPRIMLAVMR